MKSFSVYSQQSRWSRLSMVSTILAVLLVAGVAVSSLWFGVHDRYFIFALLVVVLVAMLLSALFFYPLRTEVDGEFLSVVFPLRRKSIPLDAIKSVKPYQVTMNFVRLFGSGAFFGWWGWFRNQELGRFMVYAANLDATILVVLDSGRKYVISCSDPESMADAIRTACKG